MKLLVTVRKVNAEVLNRSYLCLSVNNARYTLRVVLSAM